jgi:hypothetical protein
MPFALSYASVVASPPQPSSLSKSSPTTRYPSPPRTAPRTSPAHHQMPKATKSPPLSIHDLSRHFQNHPNPFSTPQFRPHTPVIRLLHAIADFLQFQDYTPRRHLQF